MAFNVKKKNEVSVSATLNVWSKNKRRVAELRQQMRDANKEIRELEDTEHRDAVMLEWKTISDIKLKFKKELSASSVGKRMSWQRFCMVDDYYLYALNKGQYTHRCVDGSSEWIKNALKEGKTLDELADNATRMRVAKYDRDERAKRSEARKQKIIDLDKAAAEKKVLAAKIKGNKQVDVKDPETDSTETHLRNG